MRNDIQKSYPTLVAQAAEAIAGVEQYAGPLGLSLVSSVAMNSSLNGLIAGETATKQAKAEFLLRQRVFKATSASARDYMFTARDVLKPHLGKQYSSAWDETGFVHSLAVPRNEDKLSAGLLSLNAYFTAHPGSENTPLHATASRAAMVRDELIAVRNAVNSQKTAWQLAMKARDIMAAELRRQLRALLKELSVRLSPMDERWSAFGFNKPGAKQVPPAPEGVTATLIGSHAVSVKWEPTPRAEYHRIWVKVNGVESETGRSSDLDFTIEPLPGDSTVEIAVSANNSGGESRKSRVLIVQTTSDRL